MHSSQPKRNGIRGVARTFLAVLRVGVFPIVRLLARAVATQSLILLMRETRWLALQVRASRRRLELP